MQGLACAYVSVYACILLVCLCLCLCNRPPFPPALQVGSYLKTSRDISADEELGCFAELPAIVLPNEVTPSVCSGCLRSLATATACPDCARAYCSPACHDADNVHAVLCAGKHSAAHGLSCALRDFQVSSTHALHPVRCQNPWSHRAHNPGPTPMVISC